MTQDTTSLKPPPGSGVLDPAASTETPPENAIEVLDESFYDFPDDYVAGMKAKLFAATINLDPDSITGPNAQRVIQILSARKRLSSFLDDPTFNNSVNKMREVTERLAKREFSSAQTTINELEGFPGLSVTLDLEKALSSTPVKFDELVPNPNKPTKKKISRTLPGYTGPLPTDSQRAQLRNWTNFLSKGSEHRFRVGLLKAEAKAGLIKYDEAEGLYQPLLADTPPGSPRQKLVAIKTAYNRLSQGRHLYRSQRLPGEQERQKLIELNNSAVQVLEQMSVSTDNPQRREIEALASLQNIRLQNRLNALGLWDAFVPVQTFKQLEADANTAINDAISFARDLLNFTSQGQDKLKEQNDVQFQIDQECDAQAVLDIRKENASLNVDKITEQIDAIDDKQKFIAAEALAGMFKSVVEGIVSPKDGFLVGAAGVVGAGVNFFAQRNELSHQRTIAEKDNAIALNEDEIACLEREASDHRMKFFQQKHDTLISDRVNAELLFTLAKLSERRAELRLESAIFLAYLYERAVAFFLGEPNIRHIQFDYIDREGSIFDAANQLLVDFRLVQQEFDSIQQEKIDTFTESISLRKLYPLEFSRFLQTGEMDFVYSLYQLSKHHPASHQCRLREVGVQLDALVPSTGFSGLLTHMGRFQVRDKNATLLDPDVTRLVPTDEQLEEALEAQRRDGLPVAAVGGVLYYDLDPDTKELSHKTQFVSEIQPPDKFTLDLFEGRGPTGLWKLRIFDHGQLNITDVLIHFAIVSRESDPFNLEPKVEELIRLYETELANGDQLDQIAPFSLGQNFPDTFFALQNGPADLILTDDDFPDGQTNLQFKLAILQAIDKNGKGLPGVGLEIAKPDAGFRQAGLTRADGFSEDLDAPPPVLEKDKRFPVTGAWQIKLPDLAQFAKLGDVRLFFMYAFEEL